jgi:hypothetical protein
MRGRASKAIAWSEAVDGLEAIAVLEVIDGLAALVTGALLAALSLAAPVSIEAVVAGT